MVTSLVALVILELSAHCFFRGNQVLQLVFSGKMRNENSLGILAKISAFKRHSRKQRCVGINLLHGLLTQIGA